MTENQWYSAWVKPRWHVPQKQWVAKKVQDITNKGMADTLCCFQGTVAKIELKYRQEVPLSWYTPLFFSRDKTTKKPCIISVEQRRDLEEWASAGGNAFVLIGVATEFWLVGITTVSPLNREGITIQQLKDLALVQGDRHLLGRVPEVLAKRP